MSDETFSSPPSSPPSSAHSSRPVNAASLPVDVLTIIFSHAIDVSPGVRPHGGYVESWQSNETMRGLAKVCRGWVEAATNVLYRSVSLPSRLSTDLFLRTLDTSPFLAAKVNYLALGTGVSRGGPGSPRTAEDSLALLEVPERCRTTVTRLHVHSIHLHARYRLLEVLSRTSALETLVCSPRFIGSERDGRLSGSLDVPGDPLSARSDEMTGDSAASASGAGALRFSLPPSLRRLELDFESTWTASLLPFHDALSNPEGLKRLRLRCDTDEEALLREVLGRCTGLEVCELYFEQLLMRDVTTAALLPSAHTMKHMLFITNPTVDNLAHFDSTATPIFDRLLPSYTSLETLSVSATEVSSSVIRLIPPTLQALEIQAFNHRSTFYFTPRLVEDLRNPTLATGLKSLRIHDAAEAWEEADIEALRMACEGRGIDFHFKLDSDVASHRED